MPAYTLGNSTVRAGAVSSSGVYTAVPTTTTMSAGTLRAGAVSSTVGTAASTLPYSYTAGTTAYGGLTSRPVTTTPITTGQATARVAKPATAYGTSIASYPTSTYVSGTRSVQPAITGLSTIGNFGAASLTAAPMTSVGTTKVISGTQFAGARPATYIGGTPISTQSTNLLAAGSIVSERVISMEECYSTGRVRSEAPVSYAQPIMYTSQPNVVTEVVQPVETVVVDQFGQMEVVQANEVVETLVQQPVEMIDGQPAEEQPQGPPRVLIICTSAAALGDQPTGAWSEEITGPYYVFSEAGCEVYISSVQGGSVPIDANSLAEGTYTENDKRFQEEGGMQLLENSIALNTINIADIDCVFLAGGHGTCMDFEANLAQFVSDAVWNGRPVGAVCHGVIGLLSAVNGDGTPLLQGKQVTGFSNAEEAVVGLDGVVPYLVEDRMKELGAAYSCVEPWGCYAITDGQIITGQNPQSSVEAARQCVVAMSTPQQ